jgi:hypothetical protein
MLSTVWPHPRGATDPTDAFEPALVNNSYGAILVALVPMSAHVERFFSIKRFDENEINDTTVSLSALPIGNTPPLTVAYGSRGVGATAL